MKSSTMLVGVVGLAAVAYLAKSSGGEVLASTAVPQTSPSPEGLVWYGADPGWSNWSANAMCWLKRMGYAPSWMGAPLVTTGVNPTGHTIVRDSPCMRIYSPDPSVSNPSDRNHVIEALKAVPNVYYHLAHGDYLAVQSGQKEWIYANEFFMALPESKGKFAFLGSCGAFNDPGAADLANLGSVAQTTINGLNKLVGKHTLPEAFIKSYETVVGYKNIPAMSDWTVSLEWQDVMFSQLALGETVEYACKYAAGEIGSSAEQIPEMMGHYVIAGNAQNTLVEA